MTAADHANRLRESLANASQAFDVDGRQVLASEMQRNIQDVDALQAQAETADEWERWYKQEHKTRHAMEDEIARLLRDRAALAGNQPSRLLEIREIAYKTLYGPDPEPSIQAMKKVLEVCDAAR